MALLDDDDDDDYASLYFTTLSALDYTASNCRMIDQFERTFKLGVVA
jgi:hypothetical protein